MYKCEECGEAFEEPDWDVWEEKRPVGYEPMAQSYCPYCGSEEVKEAKWNEESESWESVRFPLWGF